MHHISGNIAFTITEITDEKVIAEMPVTTGILNPFGVVNAGAILWFADVCATVLVFGNKPMLAGASGFPLGISLNANIVGNQKDGVFIATSTFVKRGKQLSIVRTMVTGAEGRLLADVTTSHMPAK